MIQHFWQQVYKFSSQSIIEFINTHNLNHSQKQQIFYDRRNRFFCFRLKQNYSKYLYNLYIIQKIIDILKQSERNKKQFQTNNKMSSSIKRSAKDVQNELVNGLIDLIISAQIKVQQLNDKHEQNLHALKGAKYQICELEKQNIELDQIIQILGSFESGDYDMENNEILMMKNQTQTKMQNNKQMKMEENIKQQSKIQVTIPQLDNLSLYFTQMCQEELINKYVQSLEEQKQQCKRHNQQIEKLQLKLASVDQKVNETLTSFKNQRKLY